MRRGFITVLSSVSAALIGAGVGAAAMGKASSQEANKIQKLSDKHLALFLMMNQWVRIKQEGKSLESYFEKNGLKRIAIYGMSYAGETLYHELKNSSIEVAYAIDQNTSGVYEDVEIYKPDDMLQEVDAIVVTPIYFFSEIEEKMSEKLSCPILSLEDILYEV